MKDKAKIKKNPQKRLKTSQKSIAKSLGGISRGEAMEAVARVILDNVIVGTAIINPNMEIVWLNRAFRKWFPYIRPETKSLCYKSFYNPSKKKVCSYCPSIKAFKTGRMHFAETGICANGRMYKISAHPVKRRTAKVAYIVEVVEDITEQKKAEEVLRASEVNYREIFNSANDAIFIHDIKNGAILDVNEKMYEMFGYTVEEAKQLNVNDISLGKFPYSQKEAARWIRMAAKGEPQLFEWRSKAKDGSLFWVEVNLKYVNLGGEKRVLALVRDITERKIIEEELRKFKFISDNSIDGYFLVDSEARFCYVNKSACAMMGYSEKELLKLSVPDVDIIYDKQKYERLFKLIHKETVPPFETINKRKNGTTFYSEAGSSGVILDGEPYMFAVVRDISKRKRAEEDLFAERDKAQNYLNIAGVMFVALDREGKVTLINRKGCEILGYSENEIIGKDWFKVFLPASVKGKVRGIFDKLITGKIKATEYYENSIVTKGGKERIIAWYNRLLRDRSGNIIATLSSGEDITEKKQAEMILRRDKETFEKLVSERTKELMDAQNKLHKAKRLSDIGTLSAVVAHELRNPLAAIEIAAYNIKRKTKNIALDSHLLNITRKVAESEQIISNLLFYSRLRKPDYKDIDIIEILEECIASQKKLHSEHKISVIRRFRGFENISTIRADPLQIQELFSNILANAFDAYHKRHCKLVISIDFVNSSKIRIQFKDNGSGINKHDLARVCEPFFTTKSRGTGLGLTVCSQVVELHNGIMKISSQKDKGTTVTIKLPITQN